MTLLKQVLLIAAVLAAVPVWVAGFALLYVCGMIFLWLDRG